MRSVERLRGLRLRMVEFGRVGEVGVGGSGRAGRCGEEAGAAPGRIVVLRALRTSVGRRRFDVGKLMLSGKDGRQMLSWREAVQRLRLSPRERVRSKGRRRLQILVQIHPAPAGSSKARTFAPCTSESAAGTAESSSAIPAASACTSEACTSEPSTSAHLSLSGDLPRLFLLLFERGEGDRRSNRVGVISSRQVDGRCRRSGRGVRIGRGVKEPQERVSARECWCCGVEEKSAKGGGGRWSN